MFEVAFVETLQGEGLWEAVGERFAAGFDVFGVDAERLRSSVRGVSEIHVLHVLTIS